MSKGADGLRTEDLRKGRKGWWSAEFTRALLAGIPEQGGLLVEIGCGLGKVATEVLPLSPGLRYVGVDIDPERAAGAKTDLEGAPGGERARVLVARGEALPLADASADCVLTAMTLMHVPDPQVVLAEALRVLRPGGALLCAEPDNLGQRWYFDGFQEGVTRGFAALATRSRELYRPADLSIGPRVAGLVRAAGFAGVDMCVHATFAIRYETAESCAKTWRWILEVMAGAVDLDANAPEVAACERAIAEWLEGAEPDRECYCGSTVPMFVTTARKG
jgi:ubiquinone/menaquinone biosynthesis C-methylase UbiE